MTTIKMNNPILSSLLLPLIAVLLVSSSVRSEQSSSSSSLRGLVNTNELLPTKTLRIIGGGKSELGRFPYYAIMNGESLCGKFVQVRGGSQRDYNVVVMNVLYLSFTHSLTHSLSIFYLFVITARCCFDIVTICLDSCSLPRC